MKDKRVQLYHSALGGLVESLNAIVRLARWYEPIEAAPELLRTHASLLSERLDTANRLAGAQFVGTESDVAKVAALGDAMKRLEAAYLTFQQQAGTPDDSSNAAMLLEAEVSEVESQVLT